MMLSTRGHYSLRIASSVLRNESPARSKDGKIRSAQGSGQPCKERYNMECELRQKIAQIDLLCELFVGFASEGSHRRLL